MGAAEAPQVAVANETRARLVVRSGASALVLAPLERRLLDRSDYDALELGPLELLGYVRAESLEEKRGSSERALYLAGFVYGGLGFLLWGVFAGTSWLYWALLGLVVAAAAVYRLRNADVGVTAVQALYLLIVLGLGVALPMAAVWAGGDVSDVWDDALHATGDAQELATLTLLGRGIQTIFIVVVTLLPGLLYFLFDRYRLSTLEAEFTKQIFRLDRKLETRADVYAKYGHLIDEAYGRQRRGSGRSGRFQPGTRLPIVIATVVFALGWIIVLLNAETKGGVIQTGVFRSLITPWRSATAFAFLGAYVFVLQAALRAYLRGDLRPKFYSYATLRVVVAVVSAWVLEVMTPSADDASGLLVAAFAIGLVPETFLLRLREYVRGTTAFSGLVENRPLTCLEGIDVYDRARLEQEGVTNVEALAHSNLVELILQTRIPASRLVDWSDQAQLRLHLDGRDEVPDETNVATLRKLGIRTASDLLTAVEAAARRGDAERTALVGALGAGPGGVPVLQTVIDTIGDDEWMLQIRDWHDAGRGREVTLRYPDDFAGGRLPLLEPAAR